MGRLLLAVLFSLAIAACGSDAPGEGDATPDAGGADQSDADTQDASAADGSGDDQDTEPAEPTFPDVPEGWTVIEPGGETICSRGTDYRYAVRRGTVNKVVIDFMGGGACWDDLTCSIAGSIFNDNADDLEAFTAMQLQGIYNVDNPDNPFADWWHIFIPYCTGDIHWGNATTTYGSGANEITIEHRGGVNARAVLDWAAEEFSGPDQIFVTGCSAGAYGSILWAPEILERFPDAQLTQMGDSGAGIITDEFFSDSFPSWNALDSFPAFIPTLDPATNDIEGLNASDLYGRIAQHYPDIVFSQYHTAYDNNQAFYFSAMGGGDQFAWSEQMYERMDYAESLADNVTTFIAPGERHCIVVFDAFYEVESNGVRLVDWVNQLIAGERPESVRCVDCEPPE